MKYHTLFIIKIGKMLQNLSSAAVVIGALRVNIKCVCFFRFARSSSHVVAIFTQKLLKLIYWNQKLRKLFYKVDRLYFLFGIYVPWRA